MQCRILEALRQERDYSPAKGRMHTLLDGHKPIRNISASNLADCGSLAE
jgi:hypothetical protein